MAHGIVAEFWSQQQADVARSAFEDVFQKGDLSKAQTVILPSDIAATVWIVDLLKALGALTSSSEAKRLIEAGSVLIDGVAVTEFKAEITWKPGMTIKVGKHRIYVIA